MPVSSGIEPLPLGKFKRLTLTVDASAHHSTASITLLTLVNTDSGAQLWSGKLSNIGDMLAKLGFTVTNHNYTAPAYEP